MEPAFPNSGTAPPEHEAHDSESENSSMHECSGEPDVTSSGGILRAVTELSCDIPGKKSYEIRGVTFTIHEKYRLIKVVGVGAYGVVIAAEDTQSKEFVALKKISGVFDDLTDARRILREIRLMQTLNHENVSSRLVHIKFAFSAIALNSPFPVRLQGKNTKSNVFIVITFFSSYSSDETDFADL